MSSNLDLKLASTQDAPEIFKWRNDPWIVQLSEHQNTVSWDEHLSFIEGTINSSNDLLYIIRDENLTGMGIVRFSKELNIADVSIYLMKEFTGMGFGSKMLDLGCSKAFRHWPDLDSVCANIRDDNYASIKTFNNAGFELKQATSPMVTYHLARK